MSDNQNSSTSLDSLSEALPKDLAGWSIGEDDQTYTPGNLFEYIDGGAELYISYGFEKVFSRTFTREGQPDIIVDIFDMGNSFNAFGIFSHSRESIEADFGQGSQVSPGLLLFWKDRFYISILASPETVESKAAMFELARHIESCIPREGKLPELLGKLPQGGLHEESIRFFHHYIWLNSHYFISNENILFIDENTDAVLAKYGAKGSESILLLVKYTHGDDAKRARKSFIENYLPECSDCSLVEMKDGTWTGCRIEDKVLAIVFSAPDRSTAQQLLDRSLEGSEEGGNK